MIVSGENATIVQVFSGLLQAVFSGGLLVVAWRQAQTMDRMQNTADRQTALTEKQSDFARQQNEIMERQIEIARQTYTATYRPKLVLREITCYPAGYIDIPFEFRITNIGGVPAKISCTELALRISYENRYEVKIERNGHEITINPGSFHNMRVNFGLEISRLFQSAPSEATILFEAYFSYYANEERNYQIKVTRSYDRKRHKFDTVDNPDREYND